MGDDVRNARALLNVPIRLGSVRIGGTCYLVVLETVKHTGNNGVVFGGSLVHGRDGIDECRGAKNENGTEDQDSGCRGTQRLGRVSGRLVLIKDPILYVLLGKYEVAPKGNDEDRHDRYDERCDDRRMHS